MRLQRVGFYELIEAPGLCVLGSLSHASWNIDNEKGNERPWLFVVGQKPDETQPGLFAVQLPGGTGEEQIRIVRMADLPFTPQSASDIPLLQVRSQDWQQMAVMPAQVKPRPTALPPVILPSGTSGTILFSQVSGPGGQIFSIEPDGSQLIYLAGLDDLSICPAWSPDGEHISFVSDETGISEIYRMERVGTDIIRMTGVDKGAPPSEREGEQRQYDCPEWSPDGSQLAAIYRTGSGDYLALISTDGSEPQYIRIDPASLTSEIAWSADGKTLAFVSGTESGSRASIFSLDVESVASGTAQLKRLVTAPGRSAVTGLVFDGNELAYLTSQYAAYDGNINHLHWIDLEGNAPREPLILPSGGLNGLLGRSRLTRLQDGQLLAMVHHRPEDYFKTSLVIIDPASESMFILARLPDYTLDTAVSPDGRWLAYTTESGLYVLDHSTGPNSAEEFSPVQVFEGRVNMVDWR